MSGPKRGRRVTGTAWAGSFDSEVGIWWGQAEYLVKVNAVVDESSQAVVDLTGRVKAGGNISSVSPANGCQLSGVLTPFSSMSRLGGPRAGFAVGACHSDDGATVIEDRDAS